MGTELELPKSPSALQPVAPVVAQFKVSWVPEGTIAPWAGLLSMVMKVMDKGSVCAWIFMTKRGDRKEKNRVKNREEINVLDEGKSIDKS